MSTYICRIYATYCEPSHCAIISTGKFMQLYHHIFTSLALKQTNVCIKNVIKHIFQEEFMFDMTQSIPTQMHIMYTEATSCIYIHE